MEKTAPTDVTTLFDQATPTTISAQAAVFPVLISLSFCHLLNDLIQS